MQLSWKAGREIRPHPVRCLTENTAMLHIARKSGMKIVTRRGTAEGQVQLPPPDARTLAAEFLLESVALFSSSLEAQLPTPRPGARHS
jgi:hypothetical protein